MFGELFNIEKILGVCDKILYFLKINFLFLISNTPLLLFFLFQGISQVRTFLPFFLLCLVPAGPALSAVFFAMNRMLKGTETGAWKDYFTGYRDSWGKKMALAGIQVLLIWIFWTNVEFFSIQMPVIPCMILFVILFAAAVLMTPNLYLLASRYEMSIRDLLKGSVILLITKPAVTFGQIAVTAFLLMLLEIQAGTVILFLASIYGFLIVFLNRNVFRTLEESRES